MPLWVGSLDLWRGAGRRLGRRGRAGCGLVLGSVVLLDVWEEGMRREC